MYCSPWTIETTAITAATPMTMPSVVRIERILLARSAESAMRKFSRKTMPARAQAGGAAGTGSGGGLATAAAREARAVGWSSSTWPSRSTTRR